MLQQLAVIALVKAAYMNTMISFTNLKEALPLADIVISVLPKTTETTHLLKEEHFVAMKTMRSS